MAINIQIISRETVKPSSPTPNNLRTHKLSLVDQLSPPKYSTIVLFYPSTCTKSNKPVHDQLRISLSKTLTHFYPFAGRFEDIFSINCNDHGACYIEARVASDLSEFLTNHLQPENLAQLLPCHPLEKSADVVDQLILGVQVSSFSCGGIAIGASIWHTIADGSALASFVTSWAAIARGDVAYPEGVRIDGTVTDCSSLFPPRDLTGFSTNYSKALQDSVCSNKFLFEGSKITSLKEKIGNRRAVFDRPITRFEALVALVWGAVIDIDQDENALASAKSHCAVTTVELRQRMNPPLPQHCIGNNVTTVVANWPMGAAVDHNLAARKIGELIRTVDDGYARKLYSGDQYFNSLKRMLEQDQDSEVVTRISIFTSLCRFPFWEVDFGFGKPARVAPVLTQRDLTIFVDAKGGEGIEAWVALSKEDMAKFEKNPGILEYAIFTPSA